MKRLQGSNPCLRCLYVMFLVVALSLLTWAHPHSAVADDDPFAAPSSGGAAIATRSLYPPSVVTVAGEGFDYTYEVNGARETIRGVGYNAIYRYLSPEVRAQMYDRDFWLMRRAGINTIEGWDQDKGYVQDKFDELLLTKAEEWGIGVIMPYYLSPSADYTDYDYRARIAEDVANWVRHYKDYSAVRMWGLGNEVLFAMEFDEDGKQARAFAEFLVELADMVHDIDPNHPVIYRESEDVYVPILRDAITKDGIKRSWLVYGMNVYTFRIGQILSDWPEHGLDLPVVVSEFAPVGLQDDERAAGYAEMWRTLRSYPPYVFGGLAYVWTTEGPEPVDREFGLLYGNDVAVDDSFNQLTDEFLLDEALEVERITDIESTGG